MPSLLQDHLSVRSTELPDSNCSREARTGTPLTGGLVTRGGFYLGGSLDVQPASIAQSRLPASSHRVPRWGVLFIRNAPPPSYRIPIPLPPHPTPPALPHGS